MNRTELIEKIKRIDENIYFSSTLQPGVRASVVIVGASALLLYGLSRKGTTKDVDVYEAEQSIEEMLYADRDFNGRCNAHSQCLPYNYEDRLEKIDIDTFAIDIFVPSVEDLAVMKLYRWEAPDIVDLTDSDFLNRLDWDMLSHLVYSPNEAAASRIAEPENDQSLQGMRHNYAEYEKRYRR